MNLIYVDDKPIDNLVQNLRYYGHNITHHVSGAAALAAIQADPWHYDLVMIDQNLNETTSPEYNKGTQLGYSIATSARHIPMIMITGEEYNIETAIHALVKCGFSHFVSKLDFMGNTLDLLIECTTLEAIQLKWDLRKSLKEKIILQAFRSLPDGERISLQNLTMMKALTGQETITVGEDKTTIAKFLKGWLDTETLTAPDLSELVSDLLHQTDPHITFNGTAWNTGPEHELLGQYLTDSMHDQLMKSIDHKALDLLLEMLAIRDEYDRTDEIELIKNKLPDFCNACKIEDNDVFIRKLIARRVFLAYGKLFERGDKKLYLEEWFSLLKRNITYDPNSGILDIGELGRKLGLFSRIGDTIYIDTIDAEGRKVPTPKKLSTPSTKPTQILNEEARWLKNYATYAPHIFRLLLKFAPAIAIPGHPSLKGLQLLPDISSLKEGLDKVRTSNPELYTKVLSYTRNQIREIAKDADEGFEPLMNRLLAL